MITILIVDDEFQDYEYIAEFVHSACQSLALPRNMYSIERAIDLSELKDKLSRYEQQKAPLLIIFDLRFLRKQDVDMGDYIVSLAQRPGTYLGDRPMVIFSALFPPSFPSETLRRFLSEHKTRIPVLHKTASSVDRIRQVLIAAVRAVMEESGRGKAV